MVRRCGVPVVIDTWRSCIAAQLRKEQTPGSIGDRHIIRFTPRSTNRILSFGLGPPAVSRNAAMWFASPFFQFRRADNKRKVLVIRSLHFSPPPFLLQNRRLSVRRAGMP